MSRSTINRSLEPLVACLWGFFLGATVLLAAVWIGLRDEDWARQQVANEGLRATLVFLARNAAPIWLVLAVVNIHLAIAQAEGLRTARVWLLIVLVGSLFLGVLLTMFNAFTGRIHFIGVGEGFGGGALGPQMAGVPIGWPLLWVVLVIGARELILWIRPRTSHLVTALIGTALVFLTFVNMEPLVHGGRWRWWIWYSGKFEVTASPQWFALLAGAALLSFRLRKPDVMERLPKRPRKPALVFLIFSTLLVLTQIRLWLSPPATPMELPLP